MIPILRDRIHKTSFSSYLKNVPNKLVLNYTWLERLAGDKQSSLLDPFVSYQGGCIMQLFYGHNCCHIVIS
jgi:hypothetical protein